MKLAFSNIAWSSSIENAAFAILKEAGISGIEVAPTRFWPDWQGAQPESASAYAANYRLRGFSIPALQAILFARPDLPLFGTGEQRDELRRHLCTVAELAGAFGARSLVFGAPKNRQPGELSPPAAFDSARDFFKTVAPHYARLGVCLCLEANPTQYGCTFVTDSAEAARLVRAVDSPGFGLHLDTACMFLAGDAMEAAITNNIDIIRHFHVSEPFLGSFATPQIDHHAVAAILREANYREWISLEMRETDQPLADIRQAAETLARTYTG